MSRSRVSILKSEGRNRDSAPSLCSAFSISRGTGGIARLKFRCILRVIVEEPRRRSVGILMKHGSDRGIGKVHRACGLAVVAYFGKVDAGSEAAAIFCEPTAVEEIA